MRKKPEEKIAELQAARDQLNAQIEKHRARQRVRERKEDTRRKIIAGALALEHATVNAQFRDELHKLIREHVTRDGDRALFDLKP